MKASCLAGLASAVFAASTGCALAEISDGVVRIGVLNDTSGVFQDYNGPGSIEAARMAAEDFAGGGKRKAGCLARPNLHKTPTNQPLFGGWPGWDSTGLARNCYSLV